jgi:putative membrane protein
MAQLDAFFSQADRDAVNRAVKEAESRTSAEIIPVIAASSGRYDRSEDVAGLWCGLALFLVVWSVFPTESHSGSWSAPAPVWQFLAFASSIVAGFLIGAVVVSRTHALRRLFTPVRQLRDEVQLRARAVFFDQRVHHTQGASGVLLYVSLFERMATVLADKSVVDKLGQPRIDALCAEFTGRLQAASSITALTETIQAVGRSLSESLPRADDDVNELADALVVLD